MANAWAGNTIFCDTASASFAVPNIRIVGIIVRTNGGDARVTLGDNNSGRSYPTVLDFSVPSATLIYHLDLSQSPILFPSGIRIKTLTTCTVCIITDRNSQ
jgi:hypothetical protein